MQFLGQLDFGEETTWGTAATPNRSLPFTEGGLQANPEQLAGESIISGALYRRNSQRALGNMIAGGSLQFGELYSAPLALLLKYMLGKYAGVSGPGPYTHTIEPGAIYDSGSEPADTPIGLTVQQSPVTPGGTVTPLTFLGCLISRWEIGLAANAKATLGIEVVAQDVDDTPALATPTYTSGAAPFIYHQGSLQVASVAQKVRSITLTGEHPLAERFNVGSRLRDKPVTTGMPTVTGNIEVEFVDKTYYNRVLNQDHVELQLVLSNGTDTLTLTSKVVFTSDPVPGITDKGLIVQTLPFEADADTADTDAISATLVNSESSL